MSSLSTFTCRHCKQRCKSNPRLKGTQRYCGKRCCQQARKNKWENARLEDDPLYRSGRKASKTAWYKKYPGDRYQSLYRQDHSGYVQENVRKQLLRNKKRRENVSASKIVKTDALIVEIRYGERFQNAFSARSP